MISLTLFSIYLIALAFVPPMAHLGYPLAVGLTLPITLLALLRGVRGQKAIDLILPVALFALLLEPFNGCDTSQGLYWLFLGPGVGFIFGLTLGRILHRMFSLRRAGLFAALLVITSLTAAGWRLYIEPQLFSYEAFFGIWHGPIYDEWVVIKGSFVAFRLSLLLLALSMYWASKRPSIPAGIVVALCFVTTLPGWYLGDRQTLNEVLDQRLESEGVVIFHQRGDQHRREAQSILSQALFERADLTKILQSEVTAPPVTIWLYPSRATKGRLIGAHGVIIARPWQREIHMHGTQKPDPYLRHEMVHVLGADLAGGPFGVPLDPLPDTGLIEGLAVALGPHDGEISLQGAAAGMLDQGRLPKVQDLFSVRFSLGHGRRSYRAAGAFLQFIAREQGWKTVMDAYRKGGLKRSGLDLEKLENRWHQMLKKHPPELGARRALIRGYSGHSILKRACPNEVQAAWHHAQTSEDIPSDERERRYRQVMALSGNCRPLASLADRYHRLGDVDGQLRIENEMLARGASQRDLGRLFMRRADAASKRGDKDEARQHLARALATAPPPHRYRGLLIRWLLRDDLENLQRVAAYLTTSDRKVQEGLAEAFTAAYGSAHEPSRPAIAYLLARWYSIKGHLDVAENWSRRAHPLPPTLAQERLRFSAQLAERREVPCLALERWQALAQISPADRDLLPQRSGLLAYRHPEVSRCGIAPAAPLR